MTHLLDIQHLSKSYQDSEFTLSDISFSIAPQEVVGLIGKNGSGKSTLINTLVGNRSKDSGEIKFFDKTISGNDNEHKEHLGVVFDDLRVPNKLSLQDIDKMFQHIYRHWDSKRFFELAQFFELPTKNQVKSFSRGMRMKAALSIALSHQSKLLILDEVTAGMDASGREEVMELLEDFIAEGNSILMSSHISEDIEHLATKLVFMRDGKVILIEDKATLLNQYGIVDDVNDAGVLPNDIIVASKERHQQRTVLINDRHQVQQARPLNSIDDATKIMMRGDLS